MSVSEFQKRIDAAKQQAHEKLLPGTAVLDAVETFLRRFVCYPSDAAAVAHTLWCAHAHAMDCWESTPRIAFLSPEPASGKTRSLEAMSPLVPRPVEAINVTPAYLFRKVDSPDGAPTILFDEIDTVFGPKAKDNEEIRALINAGHRRGATAGRCVVHGKTVLTEEIPAYCAVALAGLGWLPDTILTRSVVVRMRRRAPNETVEPWRSRVHRREGEKLGERLGAWTAGAFAKGVTTWPTMPDGVEDRAADVWEPLLAVANAAGGEWPERAKKAAVELVEEARAADRTSLGVRLLGDLRRVFGDREAMTTVDILSALRALDEAPWADLKGKELDPRGLSARLRDYGIKPKVIRFGTGTPRGYARVDLVDAWARYLAPEPDLAPPFGQESATSATCATGPENPSKSAEFDVADDVADNGDVADARAPVADDVAALRTLKPRKSASVTSVADVADLRRKGRGPHVEICPVCDRPATGLMVLFQGRMHHQACLVARP